MRPFIYATAAILASAVPTQANSLGLDMKGNCRSPIACVQRSDGYRGAAALMDQMRDSIKKRGYRCPEPIPAYQTVESHRGEVYLVQCGSSGLRYRVEIYENRKTYTVTPTEADSVIDVFLY